MPGHEKRLSRGYALILGLVLLGGLLLVAPASRGAGGAEPVTVTDHTDPAEALGWGQRSHWKQPWRSYLDTVPAETLLDAVGINFNVSAKAAHSAARLLADSGFRRARVEIGWNALAYENPGTLTESSRKHLDQILGALRENGIRPLILLNSNDIEPCPTKHETVRLTQPAAQGARTVHIHPDDVGKVIPGRTGIPYNETAAKQLITSIAPDGTATVSLPLRQAYPVGETDVDTLLYEPFRSPIREDGTPNPAFEATMNGWLEYVGVVTRYVRDTLGSQAFDVEIWNELSFGSDFLVINRYYDPWIEWRSDLPTKVVLERTVAHLRDPNQGVSEIGIGNGFANQRPWDSGASSPAGLTANDKHPYGGWDSFPDDAQLNGNRPLDGLGQPSGWRDSEGRYHETFVPSYESFFPERPLSGIYTETLVRDISPIPSFIGDDEHGRFSRPPGGAPPEIWVTEVNLGPGSGPVRRVQMSPGEIRHIGTKNVLRYLVSYVHKGVSAIHFYAARAGDMSLIEPAFLEAASRASAPYPGQALGGETIDAVRRLTTSMGGSTQIASPRRLRLSALTDYAGNVQFEGNGTAAFPPLRNRDVFGFFPFQVDADRFVIPVYVMTRNVAEIHEPGAEIGESSRFDLPPERYRMAIAGVRGVGATATATDPLSGDAVPVDVIEASEDELVVEMPVADSPRLLTIQEAGDGLAQGPEISPSPGDGTDPGESSESPAPASDRQPDSPGTPLPRVRLRVAPTILVSRRLDLVARCPVACELRVRGRLRVGGRAYPMRSDPRGRVSIAGRGRAMVSLRVTGAVARLARLAARQGHHVQALVHVRGRIGRHEAKLWQQLRIAPGRAAALGAQRFPRPTAGHERGSPWRR